MVDSRCKSINNCYMNINVLYCKTHQNYDGAFWIRVQGNWRQPNQLERGNNVEEDGHERHSHLSKCTSSIQILFQC
jgi:hypothetical protein